MWYNAPETLLLQEGKEASVAELRDRLVRSRRQTLLHTYRAVLVPTLRSPATWLFCLIYLAAAGILLAAGKSSDVIIQSALLAGTLLFVLLTIPLTARSPSAAQEETPVEASGRLWIQLAILLVFLLLTLYRSMVFSQTEPPSLAQIPVLTPFVRFLGALPSIAVNPVVYFVLPAAALLVAGVHWREMGFGRGYRSWAVTVLWGVPYLTMIVINLFTGGLSFPELLGRVIRNSLQNGFFEEFFFRGALMSRLSRLLGPAWGLVLSSLAFGFWHLGVNATMFHGNYLQAAAFSCLS